MKWKRISEFIYDRPHKEGVILNGKYKIENCLGMGGYGITYNCTDEKTNASYVLKQLRPSRAKRLKERQRFQSEVTLLQTIDHPQIPKIFDDSLMDGQWFYVMEKVIGHNVEEILFDQKQTFSELEALRLIGKLLSILEYLHENLIFHSDLRPPNIILNHGSIYLIDFGLAKQVAPDNKGEISIKRQDDFYDFGECLLFILYSQFKGKKSRKKSWIEELPLNKETVSLLKRLLGIDGHYQHTKNIRIDLQHAINAIMQGDK